MEREPIIDICRWVKDRQGNLYRPVAVYPYVKFPLSLECFFQLFVGTRQSDTSQVLITPVDDPDYSQEEEIERCFGKMYRGVPKGFVEFYTDRLGTSYGVDDDHGAIAMYRFPRNRCIMPIYECLYFRLTERLCRIINLARRLYTTNEFTLI